jgi:hypothetical protein
VVSDLLLNFKEVEVKGGKRRKAMAPKQSKSQKVKMDKHLTQYIAFACRDLSIEGKGGLNGANGTKDATEALLEATSSL